MKNQLKSHEIYVKRDHEQSFQEKHKRHSKENILFIIYSSVDDED